ncbi:MAG: metallophosphoesterase [Lachnospiraceae bacterium]|nr:metallophosphoesterase [Lachnospiraceae bacterium]
MVVLIAVIVILVIIMLSIYVYKESIGYSIVKYQIYDERFTEDNTVIVFLSDLHNKQHGKGNSQVYADIDEISPDYVFIGGDMITSCLEKFSDFMGTLDFVRKLSDKYRVYYGMGNHEERLRRRPEKYPEGTFDKLTNTLSDIGTPILVNECVHLKENIDLYGLDLDHRYYRKFITRRIKGDYLNNILGKPDENKYNILLAHNPEHFESYANWGADLVMSGHVHGGIIRIPYLGGVISPAMKLFPKYDGGLFSEYGAKMVLSRGLGSHTIPIRINNKAELVVVELIKK